MIIDRAFFGGYYLIDGLTEIDDRGPVPVIFGVAPIHWTYQGKVGSQLLVHALFSELLLGDPGNGETQESADMSAVIADYFATTPEWQQAITDNSLDPVRGLMCGYSIGVAEYYHSLGTTVQDLIDSRGFIFMPEYVGRYFSMIINEHPDWLSYTTITDDEGNDFKIPSIWRRKPE